MNAWFVTACAIVLLQFEADARADGSKLEEQALRVAFPRSESIEKKLVLPTPAQRTALTATLGATGVPRVFQYWIARSGDRTDGYAVIDDVLGKLEPITYLLAVDPSLRVRAVEIVAYRESRGGEVQQPDWRAQFEGKDPSSPLRVGNDIRNVAGATISCRSVTDGVRREIALLDALVGRGGVPTKQLENKIDPREAVQQSATVTPVERTQLLMGTTLRIRVEGLSGAAACAATDAAFAEVARLEEMLSTWRDDSAVSRLNREAGRPMQEIPSELVDVLAASLDSSRLSDGAFDVAAGPTIELWRRASEHNAWPTDAEIAAARACSGYELIELDRAGARARLTKVGARIDLGGIGKGFALDRARAVLERAGVHSALLNFGGQILALAPPPGQPGWIVAVCNPAHPDTELVTVRLANSSISTTADYERGLEIAGRRLSHVVDPHTGMPVEGMLGATVVCASATEADALSKVPYVLGSERGMQFAKDHGLAVLLVDGSGHVSTTADFEKLVIAWTKPQ